MKEAEIEHNVVYYSPEFDEMFVGYVSLNFCGPFGSPFWTQRLSPYKDKDYKKCLIELVKIGEL